MKKPLEYNGVDLTYDDGTHLPEYGTKEFEELYGIGPGEDIMSSPVLAVIIADRPEGMRLQEEIEALKNWPNTQEYRDLFGPKSKPEDRG